MQIIECGQTALMQIGTKLNTIPTNPQYLQKQPSNCPRGMDLEATKRCENGFVNDGNGLNIALIVHHGVRFASLHYAPHSPATHTNLRSVLMPVGIALYGTDSRCHMLDIR